jgi:hypothetical protein
MIRFTCPCSEEYSARPEQAGRRLLCKCGRELEVPPHSGPARVTKPASGAHQPLDTPRPDVSSPSPGPGNASPTSKRLPLAAILVGTAFFVGVALSTLPWGDSSSQSSSRPSARAPAPRGLAPPRPQPSHQTPSRPSARIQIPPRQRSNVSTSGSGGADECSALATSRPANGAELIRHTQSGHGELTVENGSSSDAVVVLVNAGTGRAFRAMYVHALSVGRMLRVDPGTYRLQAAYGHDWDPNKWSFCRPGEVSQFAESLGFREWEDRDKINYTTFEVTLHSVAGGTARTVDIDPVRFALPPR